jgi:hypothetical protein
VRLPELRRERLAPTLAAALVAAIYLIADLRTGDLAAHLYRADLFAREGFTIWNGNWYGGHHTPAYSVLFPPLAHLLTPQVAGALAAVAAAALFEPLARSQFGERARWGALWFGLAVGVTLFTGRLPFLFGVAVGLGALLALQRERLAIAAVLAVACSLASPVAGLFLALAALAYEVVARTRSGAVLAALAVAAPVLMSAAFPEGGFQPFTVRSYAPVPIFCALLFVILPREQKTLRVGALLYALAATAAYLIDTPMGNNAVRLAELFGGALVVCFLPWRHELRLRRSQVAILLTALAAWPLYPTVRDVIRNLGDDSTKASYYEPLLDFLEREGREPGRIEIPFTRAHFEAYEVARQWPIARGWQRQLDIERNKLFYGGVLNDLTYATWLSENGVRYVALPDAPLDTSARKEKELIERDPTYLRQRWASEHWKVYEVTLPHPLLIEDDEADVRLTSLRSDEFTLDVREPGEVLVRAAWTRYWEPRSGCVERDGHWTRVTAVKPGPLRVTVRMTPERLVNSGRHCVG